MVGAVVSHLRDRKKSRRWGTEYLFLVSARIRVLRQTRKPPNCFAGLGPVVSHLRDRKKSRRWGTEHLFLVNARTWCRRKHGRRQIAARLGSVVSHLRERKKSRRWGTELCF